MKLFSVDITINMLNPSIVSYNAYYGDIEITEVKLYKHDNVPSDVINFVASRSVANDTRVINMDNQLFLWVEYNR